MTSWRDRAPRLSKICSFKLNKPYDELSVGVVAETAPHEKRVAQTPASVGRLVQEGFKVLVEAGAGTAAGFPDGAYSQAGASVVPRHVAWTASIVLKVQPPTADEAERVGNCCLISFIWPAQNEWLLAQLQRQGATCFAMDMVPRELSRAQTFDALTSQSNLAGYRAIIEAAAVHGRFFGELVTAAGRLPALVVLVLGGGVAGLSAITHARQLGAHVRCFDVRAAVKEQAESIGATFLSVAYEVLAPSASRAATACTL
jgi:NAD(P) transhydrogenase